MIESMVAELVSAVLISGIVLFGLAWLPLLARLWVEFWAERYPEAADALRAEFWAETQVSDRLARIGRAVMFAVNVPRFARAQAEAEQNPATMTAAAPPADEPELTDPLVFRTADGRLISFQFNQGKKRYPDELQEALYHYYRLFRVAPVPQSLVDQRNQLVHTPPDQLDPETVLEFAAMCRALYIIHSRTRVDEDGKGDE